MGVVEPLEWTTDHVARGPCWAVLFQGFTSQSSRIRVGIKVFANSNIQPSCCATDVSMLIGCFCSQELGVVRFSLLP